MLLENLNFWSNFFNFKGVSPRKKWRNPIFFLQSLIFVVDEGGCYLYFLSMSVVQNFECCWKFSIFGRNSWILKVFAHENSVESQKKLKSLIFKVLWRGLLFKLSQYDRRAKFSVLLEIFNFSWKFLSFKGVSQRKNWLNPIFFLQSLIFIVCEGGCYWYFLSEHCAKFRVLLEIFNFWSKFLNFKGVSPRK